MTIIINIAMCDDEQIQRDNLGVLVKSWAEKLNFSVKIKEFTSAENFLFYYEEDKNFDIILLDIEMGGLNGVELAKQIRKQNDMVEIIFITGYSDYIADGYEVSALHYLMKPINEDKFFETLNRAVEKINRNQKTVYLETNVGNVKLALAEIAYIEVDKNYITVHAKENYTAKMTLTEVMKQLDENFIKVGRSCVINLSFIRKVTKTDVHLLAGSTVAIPRGMYEKINRAIINMR